MTAIAIADQLVSTPLSVAFEHFSDFSHWDRWMPADFRPVSGPARALQLGDRFKVAIGPKQRFKVELEVIRLQPDKELCWRGGPAILRGEHAFFFTEVDGKTQLRSHESLSGLATFGPLAAPLERACVKAAAELLGNFASYLTKHER